MTSIQAFWLIMGLFMSPQAKATESVLKAGSQITLSRSASLRYDLNIIERWADSLADEVSSEWESCWLPMNSEIRIRKVTRKKVFVEVLNTNIQQSCLRRDLYFSDISELMAVANRAELRRKKRNATLLAYDVNRVIDEFRAQSDFDKYDIAKVALGEDVQVLVRSAHHLDSYEPKEQVCKNASETAASTCLIGENTSARILGGNSQGDLLIVQVITFERSPIPAVCEEQIILIPAARVL